MLDQIIIKQGDITAEDVDAIVNAANPSLLGGGGVDGAIHRAAGPELLKECKTQGGCKHGEARITKGYNLKAKHIIHTPGPIYKNGKMGEKEILINSYYNSLKLAKENNLESIAFPAISTGVYSYPLEEACHTAITTTINFMDKEDYLLNVIFVLFDNSNYSLYNKYLEKLKNELS
ncbi:MAG: O-acetyl-ADP-ribose deacetylase [Spirochaetota bacterium]|nr:O-acetyl-ADP-ribose deacetylase [Spirochaetota bacterium]